MTVRVTWKHIAVGIPGELNDDPIFYALQDAGIPVCEVYGQYVRTEDFTWPEVIVSYFQLPESAQDFIRRFDEGEPVEPFSFDVEI